MTKKKKGFAQQKHLKKVYRFLFTLLILVLGFYFTEDQTLETIETDKEAILYSSICKDNLEKLFLEAINSANHSILLIMYTLSDKKLIYALNKQVEKGISVKLIYDSKAQTENFQQLSSLIQFEAAKRSGLMHQKILVVDEERVFIGSANMTSESLRLHHNLVVGLINSGFAKALENQIPFFEFEQCSQAIEFWSLPQKGKEGLQRMLDLIGEAKETLRIAMFTWTHAALTEAVINAHRRGVRVEVLLDSGQARAVCQQTVDALLKEGIELRLSTGMGLLHHKFAWIDERVLIHGSANWTLAAFSRNSDCFMILHFLKPTQQAKMKELWNKTRILFDKEHLPVLGQGPILIGNPFFQIIDMAA